MTAIREDSTLPSKIIEDSFDYSEIFDATKFPISAECFISSKDIAW